MLSESLCDADLVTIHVSKGLREGLKLLTIEWAQQEHNRSEWEPRPWPGEENNRA